MPRAWNTNWELAFPRCWLTAAAELLSLYQKPALVMRFHREITQRDDGNRSTKTPLYGNTSRKGNEERMEDDRKRDVRVISSMSRGNHGEKLDGKRTASSRWLWIMHGARLAKLYDVYILRPRGNPWDSIRQILIRRHFIDSPLYSFPPRRRRWFYMLFFGNAAWICETYYSSFNLFVNYDNRRLETAVISISVLKKCKFVVLDDFYLVRNFHVAVISFLNYNFGFTSVSKWFYARFYVSLLLSIILIWIINLLLFKSIIIKINKNIIIMLRTSLNFVLRLPAESQWFLV